MNASVSIIIPVFNQRPDLLKRAVLSALSQGPQVAEVVVVDDGSTRSFLELPSDSRVRVLAHAENRGISAALNTGLRAMRGSWFCWLSSDDTFAEGKVPRQLGELRATDKKAGCHGYVRVPADTDEEDGAPVFGTLCWPPLWNDGDGARKELAHRCSVNGSTVMIHRSVFDAVGEFDARYRYGQDWEMWCRIASRFDWHRTVAILGTRREGENLTETIAGNPALAARRDEEDRQIKRRWGPIFCGCEKCRR